MGTRRLMLRGGESAVGTAVNLCHLAATPMGRFVIGEAEVTKVDGRQTEFAVRATGQGDRGRFAFEGRHRRGEIHSTARMSNA